MVGYVDMNKDLDFWQVDKWCGFFPVEWHVVKDVPNWELCHIVLHNNEGKAVTHTRDTQEIKLKEGLQMLSIFKKFSAVTSLLDDMDFYEEREKSLRLKKEHKPATLRMDLFKEKDYDVNNAHDLALYIFFSFCLKPKLYLCFICISMRMEVTGEE